MTNIKRITVFILLLFIFSAGVFAEYDRDNVKDVMRANVQLMGRIGKAAASEDFTSAAVALMELAQGMISIEEYSPRRGTDESWNSIFEGFLNSVYRGIGACGNQDIDGLNKAFSELKAFNSEGHKSHK
jgi:hypothetical protein